MSKEKQPYQDNVEFTLRDFEYFHPQHRREREYNKCRLQVRRKLAALGKLLLPSLQEAGLPCVLQTSLHHPYSYNKYAVDSQWVYFAPAPETYRKLQEEILGPELGEDLDLRYTHVLLLIGIQHTGLQISLKIHQNAWWEAQNLKNKCSQREQQMVLLQLLHSLPTFCLKLHDWPNRHHCGELTADTLKQFFQYYLPTQHWLHLDYDLDKQDPAATGSAFGTLALSKLLELVPVYKFIAWSPDNNHVFQEVQGRYVFQKK